MFNILGNIITTPFALLLRFFYNFTGSYGVAIILFAVVVKLVTLPFQMKSKKSMVRMGRLTGRQQELQKQYANNQQKYQEELQKLYMEEGINPMGGCLWSFLPMFIIIPLYQIIYRPVTAFMGLSSDMLTTLMEKAQGMGFDPSTYSRAYEEIGLANFIHEEWASFQGMADGLIDVDFSFLGMNLSSIPTQMLGQLRTGITWAALGVVLIPILSAVMQFISMKVMTLSNGQQQQAGMGTMNIIMVAVSLWFCFIMPAAMGVYWVINTVLIMVQEQLLGRFYTKKLNAEEDEREAKRAESRRMRMEEAKKRAAEQRAIEEKRAKKQPKAQPKTGEKKISTNEAGRVGDRPYARGRSYKADRYEEKEQ